MYVMSGNNPFAITSDVVDKRRGVNGAQGTSGTQGTQNTQETREAKEKEELKHTNVLNQNNGGSMATTYGTFENYDGFVRSNNTNSQDTSDAMQKTKDGYSLLNITKSATADAAAEKSNCKNYQETAQNDEQFISQSVRTSKSNSQKLIAQVNKNTQQKESLEEENDSLRSDVDSLNSEIESLMAEDGQDYTPQEAPEEETPVAQVSIASVGSQGQTASPSGGASAGAGGTMTAGDGQSFAMNSLPASGGNEYAPTSITGVAAQNADLVGQNNQATQSNVQNSNNQNSQQGQKAQGAANKGAGTGNSLRSYASNIASPQGKNADKIQDLMNQVSDKNSKISSNSGTISSLVSSTAKSANSFQNQLKNIISTKKIRH